MLAVRSHAHRFLAAGDHDVTVSIEDCLITERDRTKTRPAKLVYTPRRRFHGDGRRNRSLPRRVLSLTGRKYLPHDHFADAGTFNARAVERGLDGGFAKFVSRQICKGPIERTYRGTRGAHDDNVVFHPKLLLRVRGNAAFWQCRILGRSLRPVNNRALTDILENWRFLAFSARVSKELFVTSRAATKRWPIEAEIGYAQSLGRGTCTTWQMKKRTGHNKKIRQPAAL